jgi:hypothetical protein
VEIARGGEANLRIAPLPAGAEGSHAMKGRVVDLQVERQKRRPRAVDVDLEAWVEGGHVRVSLSIEREGTQIRSSGLLEPAAAHELGALLQRVALRVPPPKKGKR